MSAAMLMMSGALGMAVKNNDRETTVPPEVRERGGRDRHSLCLHLVTCTLLITP